METTKNEKRKKNLAHRRLENQLKNLKRLQKKHFDLKSKNPDYKSELLDEFFGEEKPNG